jgi:hypothetical protein
LPDDGSTTSSARGRLTVVSALAEDETSEAGALRADAA